MRYAIFHVFHIYVFFNYIPLRVFVHLKSAPFPQERTRHTKRRKMALSSRELSREDERGSDTLSAQPYSELDVEKRCASQRGALPPDARSPPEVT